MNNVDELLRNFIDVPIALYGLSTETEFFLNKWGGKLHITGLLDGFRENGEMYGKPIVSIEDAIDNKVKLILVIARPGSCKAITRRIGNICRENNIALYDIRGVDLLTNTTVKYDFKDFRGGTKAELSVLICSIH